MRQKQLRFGLGFRVAFGNKYAQAAEMVLAAGETEGGPDNRHAGADQWMYVVSGRGRAKIEQKWVPLREGSLVLIERGETHEIRNTGRSPLRTVNFYVPPAYTAGGGELPAGKS